MTVTVIFWRDIPAQVMEGQGRSATRIALSDRFQEAIDRAATRAGLIGSDEYTAEWRKDTAPSDSDAAAVASDLEKRFTDEDLEKLIRNLGSRPDDD